MKISHWAMLLLVLSATNVATGFVVKKNARPKVDHQRDMIEALGKMGRVDGPFVVVLGDSITQNARLPDTVCGMPLINAGISGSRTSTFIPFAEEMVAQKVKPTLSVIALGVNDAISGYQTDFASAYRLLIDSLPKTQLLFVTPAPIDLSKPVAARINVATLQFVSAKIMEAANSRKARLIDLSKINIQSQDGVHPDAATYSLWIAAVVDGIESTLKCKMSGG
jgi:lysophospholipase L1-like esterase